MTLALAQGIESMDFSSISTGICGYPLPQAASVTLEAILEELRVHGAPGQVRMICHTEAAQVYRQAYSLLYAGTKEEQL